MLAYFCRKELIERVSRGIYRVTDATSGIDLNFEDLVLHEIAIKALQAYLKSSMDQEPDLPI